MSSVRTWSGFAHRGGNGVFSGTRIGIPESVIGFAGLDTKVTVIEEPSGEYRGWVYTGREADPPIMIEHARIFDMQFPYGAAAAIGAGEGSAVPLSVIEATVNSELSIRCEGERES
ncbi:hypothetical protein KV113_18625 [Mycolicibacter sp. MYC340]|nr:hypothetical protein [Mycolicibacter sp. MYC340]